MRRIYYLGAFTALLLIATGAYYAFFRKAPRSHAALKPGSSSAANEAPAPKNAQQSVVKSAAKNPAPSETAIKPNEPAPDTRPATNTEPPGNTAPANEAASGQAVTLQSKPMPLERAGADATAASRTAFDPPRAAMFTEFKAVAPPQFERILAQPGDAVQRLEVKDLDRFAVFKQPVAAVTFSPDGQKFAAGCAEGALLWTTSQQPPKKFATGDVFALAFSPDGSRLACAGPRTVQIWDTATGQQVGGWRTDAEATEALSWCPDDRMITTVQKPARVRIWRVEDGAILQEMTGSSIGFASGGSGYLLGAKAGYARIRWPPAAGSIVSRMAAVQNVCLSSDGAIGAIALADGTVIVEDYAEHSERTKSGRAHKKIAAKPAKFKTLGFLPGDIFVIAYRGDAAIDVWLADTGETAGSNDADTSQVTCGAISPDGRRAISGYRDGSVRLFSLPNPHTATSQEYAVFQREVRLKLAAKNYDQLETQIAQLRESVGAHSSGLVFLEMYYSALAYPEQPDDAAWLARVEALEAWLDEKPESLAARIALAESYVALAWQARGDGPASTVTESGGRLFTERLIKAGKLLVAAEEINEKDPHLFRDQVTVAKGIGLPKSEVYKIAAKGIEIYPRYWPLYEAMAEYLLQRWHGDPGEVARFAAQSAESIGGDPGLEIYGHIAMRVSFYEGDAEMLQQGFDLEKMQAAARQMYRRFPDSALYCNFACYVACLAKDRAAARELMPTTQNFPFLQIWKSQQSLNRYAAWANENDASP